MSRHFCRVTVPAKASSASSLCSAAPLGPRRLDLRCACYPNRPVDPFAGHAVTVQAAPERHQACLVRHRPTCGATAPLDADEQPHPSRRARRGMREPPTPRPRDEKPDPLRRATVIAHRRRMPRLRPRSQPIRSARLRHSPHAQALPSRGPMRAPDRAAGARRPSVRCRRRISPRRSNTSDKLRSGARVRNGPARA